MPLIAPSGVTVSIAANSLSGTFAGDMSALAVQPGMELFIGSRNGRKGEGRILQSFVLTGSTGASFTVGEAFSASNITAQPFVIDNFAAPVSVAAQNNLYLTTLLNALRRATGLSTTLDQASKTWELDRGAGSGTFGQWLWKLAGRLWFGWEHRTVGGVEKLLLRAYPDGTSPVDAIVIDGATGAVTVKLDTVLPATDNTKNLGSASARFANIYSAQITVDPNFFMTGANGTPNTLYDAGDYHYYDRANNNWTWVVGNNGVASLRPTEFIPLVDAGKNLGSASQRWANTYSTQFIVDGNFKLYLGGTNPILEMGSARYMAFIRATDEFSFVANGSGASSLVVGPTYIRPGLDNGRTLGVSYDRWSEAFAAKFTVDPNFYLTLSAGNPVSQYDAGDYHFYDRGSNTNYSVINNAVVLSWDANALYPGGDNVKALGAPSLRWSTVYSGTGTINTSDQSTKTPLRAFTDAELDAWGDVSAGVFQFLDAVADKGEDYARLHFGYTAQAVAAAFEAHGVDPARCALWCSDELTERVEKSRMVERPKTVMASMTRTIERQTVEMVQEPVTMVDIVDGKPVQTITMQEVEKPVFVMVALEDTQGNPVMRDEPLLDEEGLQSGTVPVPVMHPVPVMETIEETYEEPVETTEEVEETYTEEVKTGEVRLGLRYDQCAVIEGAYQRRRADRLEARIAAIESALAA